MSTNTGQPDREPLEIDLVRRTLLTTLAAGVVLGPLSCGPTREQPRIATKESSNRNSRTGDADERPVLPGVEPVMRVRVSGIRSDTSGKEAALSLGTAGQRLWVTTPELQRPGRVVYGPLRIRAADGGWMLQSEGRRHHGREQIETATPLAITAIDRQPIAHQGKGLQGTLRLVRRTDLESGDFDLVSHISMEKYLPGVLQNELYPNWPEATFQAQAIAARSYGCCERNFWRSRRHYDVVAGPASQAWSGGAASLRAQGAVWETSGLVLVWQGRMIPAYYSAACGGMPASGSDAIGKNPSNAVGPLSVSSTEQRRDRGCCENSPYASWQVQFDRSGVTKGLAKYGRDHGRRDLVELGRVDSINVLNRNPAGRPTRYRLTGSRTIELGAEVLRRVLNASAGAAQGESFLRASCIEFKSTSTGILAIGRGFGHGVGLCQYGACTMGREGADAEAILARYYPGASVQRGWDPSQGTRSKIAGA